MTTLTKFFKESTSSLGVFYPKHYLIATFATFDKTKLAAQALRKAGFSEDEVLAIFADEILEYFEDFRAHSGLWAGVMAMLSRAFGTEQIFVDDDIHSAHAGAGFLAVHCPEQALVDRIRLLIDLFEPRAMHWYEAGGIQSLI